MNKLTGERLVAYAIDTFIISLIVNLITAPLLLLIKYNGEDLINANIRASNALEEALSQGSLNMVIECAKDSFNIALLIALITMPFYLLFCILYLVVLPKRVEWQTLGRRLMKIRVVDRNGYYPATKNLALREIVGTFLMYYFFDIAIVGAIVSLVSADGRSLVDYIGGTKLYKLGSEDDTTDDYPNNVDYESFNSDSFNDYTNDDYDNDDSFKPDHIDDDDYKVL